MSACFCVAYKDFQIQKREIYWAKSALTTMLVATMFLIILIVVA